MPKPLMQSKEPEHCRRAFLIGVGAVAAAAAITPSRSASAFATPQATLQFGYTAMTWAKAERQAIDDIATAGFKGIQFRADAVTDFKPAELRELLQQHKLTFVALSSGEVLLAPAVEADQIAKHTANAKFVRDSGGLYLQVLDQLKPYPRTATPEECKRLGKLLTEIGKRTADLGVPSSSWTGCRTSQERHWSQHSSARLTWKRKLAYKFRDTNQLTRQQ